MIQSNRLITYLYDATWGRLVYARLFDWFMKASESAGLSGIRQSLISQARGRTIELGPGSGLNLDHYTSQVRQLWLVEPYAAMREVLERKLRREIYNTAMADVSIQDHSGESLPYPDDSFDTVVATMVLCTAKDPMAVLREIRRVLKPGGQYLYLEHVKSTNPSLAAWQDRLQPFWYWFACGCHCNRDTLEAIGRFFTIKSHTAGEIPKALKIVSPMIMGRVLKKRAGFSDYELGLALSELQESSAV